MNCYETNLSHLIERNNLHNRLEVYCYFKMIQTKGKL